MSRSFKKTPIVKDHDSGRIGKKQANHKVRRYQDLIPNGRYYQKIFESWDIHDQISYYPHEMFAKDYQSREKAIVAGVEKYRFRICENDWQKRFLRK